MGFSAVILIGYKNKGGNTMRKMLVLILAITMLCALSACQKEKPKPEFTLGDVDDQTY